MENSSTITAPGATRMVRETENFMEEGFCNIDGTDVRCYAKCTVDYKKPTYKVKPVFTMVHKLDQGEVMDLFIKIIHVATERCQDLIAEYQGEMGIGAQGDLFAASAAGDN